MGRNTDKKKKLGYSLNQQLQLRYKSVWNCRNRKKSHPPVFIGSFQGQDKDLIPVYSRYKAFWLIPTDQISFSAAFKIPYGQTGFSWASARKTKATTACQASVNSVKLPYNMQTTNSQYHTKRKTASLAWVQGNGLEIKIPCRVAQTEVQWRLNCPLG